MKLRATSTKSRMHLTGRRPYDPVSLGLGLTVLSVLRAFHDGTKFHRHPPSPSTSSLDLLREWRPGSAVCFVAPATIPTGHKSKQISRGPALPFPFHQTTQSKDDRPKLWLAGLRLLQLTPQFSCALNPHLPGLDNAFWKQAVVRNTALCPSPDGLMK